MSASARAHWRAFVLEGLRSGQPTRQIEALDRIRSGNASIDDEIEAALLDALEDVGAHTYRERDWDEHGELEWVPRTRRVAQEAVERLGAPSHRARAVGAIRARLSAREPDARHALIMALGHLAPQSTDFLCALLDDDSAVVRSSARSAIANAVSFSTPEQQLAIFSVAFDRRADAEERSSWLDLLERASLRVSGLELDAMHAHLRTSGPDDATLDRWLASDERGARALASAILGHRADRSDVAARLGDRIVRELPSVVAPFDVDAWGHRRCAEIELALQVVARRHPAALTSMMREPTVATVIEAYLARERAMATCERPLWLVARALADVLRG